MLVALACKDLVDATLGEIERTSFDLMPGDVDKLVGTDIPLLYRLDGELPNDGIIICDQCRGAYEDCGGSVEMLLGGLFETGTSPCPTHGSYHSECGRTEQDYE
jgi:hypothetical protein